MCCEIDVVQKAQPMPRFPDGWFFWFEKPEDSSTGDSELEGLVLYSPQNKKVVAADFVGNDDSSSVFPDVEDLESRLRDFYEYIGYLDRSRKRRSVKYNLDDFAATVEDAEPAPTKSKKRGASMSPKPASKRYKQTVKKRSSTTSEASSSSSWQGEVNQKPPPEKDEEPEIGDRVYSCFDDEDNWYWGKVTDKFMKGDSVRYSVSDDVSYCPTVFTFAAFDLAATFSSLNSLFLRFNTTTETSLRTSTLSAVLRLRVITRQAWFLMIRMHASWTTER